MTCLERRAILISEHGFQHYILVIPTMLGALNAPAGRNRAPDKARRSRIPPHAKPSEGQPHEASSPQTGRPRMARRNDSGLPNPPGSPRSHPGRVTVVPGELLERGSRLMEKILEFLQTRVFGQEGRDILLEARTG